MHYLNVVFLPVQISEAVDFTKADLSHAVFFVDGTWTHVKEKSGTVFNNASLSYACLKQCDFIGTSFTGADLSNAEVDNASFKGGCDFSAATLIKMNGNPVFNDVRFNHETRFIHDFTLGEWHEEIRRKVISEFPGKDADFRKTQTTIRFRTEVESAARRAGIAISADITLQDYYEDDRSTRFDENEEPIYDIFRIMLLKELPVPISVPRALILEAPRSEASKLHRSIDDTELN